MAKHTPGPNEVRIIVNGAWTTRDRRGRPGYYWRNFGGITLAEAIRRLDGDSEEPGQLPNYIVTMAPYFLNGVVIHDAEHSEIVLKPGDILRADDP
ncbi:MAG TPA: hypothetical protein VG917_03895 [Patescibacteria group bacterium]|nr:hypothetical protein [Patescibacteria group bacterium]